MRCFEGDPSARLLNEGLQQLASRAAASWEEAEVDELVGVDAGHAQGRGQGRGAGNGDDGVAGVMGGGGKLRAGIADGGGAGVGDEGDVTLRKGFQQHGQFRHPVVVVVAGAGGVNVVAGEEPSRRAGIFGGDEGYLAEHAECTQGDVLQIADWRCYDVER